jgi:hypothetical protein
MEDDKVQAIPFQSENAMMNNLPMAPGSVQSLVSLKGVSIVGITPCCPPCECMRKRRYTIAPIGLDGKIGAQMALAIDMTGCCDKKKHSSIGTAPLLLELSENKKKLYTGVIPAMDKCCRCVSCCPSLLPMTINNDAGVKIGMMTRELPSCGQQTRTFFDASGTPKYRAGPPCCRCGGCTCGNFRCCFCLGCCGCESVRTIPIIGFQSGDDGVLTRRVRYCPPCSLPSYEIIFPAGASQELRLALILGTCEMEYFDIV